MLDCCPVWDATGEEPLIVPDVSPSSSVHGLVHGVILAGGAARRLGGGDKLLLEVGGRSILDRVRDGLSACRSPVLLNANGPADRFAGHGLPVLADSLGADLGPLAGVLTALDWAAGLGGGEAEDAAVLTVPGDTPFLPKDLVERLWAARAARPGAEVACAASGGRRHPVVALWPVSLRHDLRRAVVEDGLRRLGAWMDRRRVVQVDWPVVPVDPFFNVNTPDDLAEARRLVARLR